ncbi:MFS transporter [Streptomyces somaliensis]|uniref:MFS transporter n=1 Tax=Streptomyces somaliensis TaxID=78355 RepID=UPI0020CC88B8|nr:MFS transporter [Streptomyces somaliensis]MCP9944319.1 MFS transporter [Streptomyces somaliensis]MCP9962439.1 MFS transporter [Streptomyces somaliensis]
MTTLDVLRDGPFRTLVLLSLLMCTVFSTVWMGLPLTMTAEGLEPESYGVVVAVNGVVIVAFQLLVNRITEGRSPAALLVVSALLFAVGLGATALAESAPAFALTVVVWTVGEMVYIPVNAAATARLAPVHARGRYQGVMGMSWSIGGFVAPVTAGWVVEGPGPDALWLGCTVVSLVAAAGYALLRGPLNGPGTEAGADAGPVVGTGAEAGPVVGTGADAGPVAGTGAQAGGAKVSGAGAEEDAAGPEAAGPGVEGAGRTGAAEAGKAAVAGADVPEATAAGAEGAGLRTV